MHWIRWVAVPIAAVGGWLAVLYAGITFDTYVENLWCGEEAVRTYQCTQPQWLHTANVVLFSSLSAAVVMVCAVLVAPKRTPSVVWAIFCTGGVAAIVLSGFGTDWLNLLAVLASGAATALVLVSRLNRLQDFQ